MLRGVLLYNFSGERLLESLQPLQVRRVICLQFNDIRMFSSVLEKLQHLRKHATQDFGTNLGKSTKDFFLRITLYIMHSYYCGVLSMTFIGCAYDSSHEGLLHDVWRGEE